jgi:adenylyltransferase/sulfurtransferase
MESAIMSAENIKKQILETEAKLQDLKGQLAKIKAQDLPRDSQPRDAAKDSASQDSKWPLSPEEYNRYGRQMIVPTVGIRGM